MKNKCQHLIRTQSNELQKINEFFHGKLGTWETAPVYLKQKYYVKPIFSRPYPIPKLQKEMFQNEAECLVLLEFLERDNL